MAKADLLFFNDFTRQLALKLHELEADTIRFALCTNATVPALTSAIPCFGAGGTVNFAATEVSGTNYAANGEDISGTLSFAGAAATFDGTGNPAWTQHAAGPSDIRWGIIYNDTAAIKNCIAYVDMGGGADISLIDGDISYTFAASIGTITRT